MRRRDVETRREEKTNWTKRNHTIDAKTKYVAAHVARARFRDKQIEKKWTGYTTSFNIIRHTQIHTQTHTQRERW